METKTQSISVETYDGTTDKATEIVKVLNEDQCVTNAAVVKSMITQAVEEPTAEETEKQALLESILGNRMSFSNPVKQEEYLLEIDEHGFFAQGDVHGIKAKQKSGKTSVIMVMVAALISGQCFRVRCLKKDLRIIWIDTEQKSSDTYLNYDKVFELAKIEKKDMHDRFEQFSLRRFTMEEKMNALKLLISTRTPNIVFVDGIVDLVKNFNEVEDSQEIITQMMKLSAEFGCAIVCVLHTNKDATDHNMRGHLGTMLSQRAGNVFECQKNDGVITVSCSDSRHGDVPEWSIMYDDAGNLVDADAIRADALQVKREEQKRIREEKRQQADEEHLTTIKKIIGTRMPMTKLVGLVAPQCGISTKTAKRWIMRFINEGKLYPDGQFVQLTSERVQPM